MKNGNLIKNGSLYVFGNIFNKAIAVVTVPLFTRILTTSEYGVVNTYGSWVSVFSVIVGLSLGETIRNAFVDMHSKLREYMSSIFTLAAINLAVILLICIGVVHLLNIPSLLLYLCVIESFFNFVINAVISVYTIEEEAVRRTLLMVFPNLIGTIFSVILISKATSGKEYGYIIGFVISSFLFGVFFLVWYWCKYRTFVKRDYWSYALLISTPLIFHSLSHVVLGSSDRTIITLYRGATETGIYSLIYKLNTATSVVTSSAEGVWLPKFIKKMKGKQFDAVSKMNQVYIYFVLFTFCGIFTLAPEMVRFLGGEEYMSGINMVFPIVMSAFIMFLYGIYLNVEYYYKETKMIATSAITAAILNLVLNIIFIPMYGAIAAAYTTLFSYLVSLFMHMNTARKISPEVTPPKELIIPITIAITAGIFTNITRNHLFIRWGSMISLGIGYVFFVYKFVLKNKEDAD